MYNTQVSPRATITPVAGQRVGTPLENNVQTHAVRLTVRGSVVITSGATTIINGGSILGCIEEIGIRHGRDIYQLDPLVARYLSEAFSAQPLAATRLGATTAATYPLVEQVTLFMASPHSLVPRETAMMERNPRQALEVFVKQKTNSAAGIVNGTVTVTGLSVEVEQLFDAIEAATPYFQPQISQLVVPVTAANTRLEQYIRTSEYLRGIVITERTSGAGLVTDILNRFALKSASRDYIGSEPVKKDNWQRATESWAGGAVYSPEGSGAAAAIQAAHTFINFQQYGRLSSILPPTDINLRLLFDCQPSVTSGAVTSELVVTLLELVRDPFVDPQTGRRVATPDLPFLI